MHWSEYHQCCIKHLIKISKATSALSIIKKNQHVWHILIRNPWWMQRPWMKGIPLEHPKLWGHKKGCEKKMA
jgi:hypothetical protein